MLRNARSYKTLEAETEKRLTEKITNLGGLCWKFTSPGNVGVPDRIIIFRGLIGFIELKAPGKDLRDTQKWRKAQIEREGFSVLRIRTKEEVDNFVEGLVKYALRTAPVPADSTELRLGSQEMCPLLGHGFGQDICDIDSH